MSSVQREVRFRLKRDDRDDWTTKNPVLMYGEPGFETDTGQFKLGDGVTEWNNLDYFLPTDLILELIAENSSSSMALNEHINDTTPHPVYDDGPSLALLWQNATA